MLRSRRFARCKFFRRGDSDRAQTSVKADFSSLPPETAKAMEELTDAVVRNYVRYPSCTLVAAMRC
jgi:hypothetical protein